MSEGIDRDRSKRQQRNLARKQRGRRWILLIASVLAMIVAGTLAYRWFKGQRAERFAAAGNALVAADKWNDAAVQYRVALHLDPSNYHGLSGAARLASKAERPEALELWQKVLALPQCTIRDREDYAELLIKTNRLNLAEKAIDPLLKDNPDTKALQLAARYARKIGDNVKAGEYLRIASKRAPDDDAPRFQLAEVLAQSTDAADQAEARKILWELAARPNVYKKAAVEALGAAPELTTDERKRLLQELMALTPETAKDDLLAADMRVQLQPDEAARIYREEVERWRNGQSQELLDLARWLNAHQQPELVLSTFPVERTLEDNQLLLARLDALATLQRWNDIDGVLNRTDVTLDPSSGDTAAERAAMSKISARAPEDPNAADQLAYLNLLLGEDVDQNFAVAKKLAEQYPNRLSYRVTTALGYLRQHDPASAMAQFKGPVSIDWKRTLPAWRAVYAAALLASDRNDEARDIIATISRNRLNPQERELIESPQGSN